MHGFDANLAIQRHALDGFDESHGGRVEACSTLDPLTNIRHLITGRVHY
jgi:hypothetical protein